MYCNVELHSAVLYLSFQPTCVMWVLEVAIFCTLVTGCLPSETQNDVQTQGEEGRLEKITGRK
jgi:hypothetical protein